MYGLRLDRLELIVSHSSVTHSPLTANAIDPPEIMDSLPGVIHAGPL